MKKTFALISLAACFYACQKEVSEVNSNTRNTSNGLLVKRIDFRGTDSTITIFQYDANDHLIVEDALLKSGNTVSKHIYTRYYRDTKGRITTIARIGPYSDIGNNADTIFTSVTYADATSSKVAYLDNHLANYTYDANGHVIKITSSYGYTDYSYDANGNITKSWHYEQDGNGGFSFNIGYDFEYDNKINPHFTGDDAVIEFRLCLSGSPNNLLKQVTHYGANANIPDDNNNTVYEYNADNKPGSSAMVSTAVAGGPWISHYFYQ